jgi:nicotinate-nucleotide pyrophosphorylase (carboxylating)
MFDYKESSYVQAFIQSALREDVGDGDHSSLSCIPSGQEGDAELKVKEAGVLAGMVAAEKIFKMVDPSATFVGYKKDY